MVPSGGWSGPEDPFRPSGGSSQSATFRQFRFPLEMAPVGMRSCRAVRSFVALPKQGLASLFPGRAFRPTAARHSLHLRFAKPGPKDGEACFPTLLRASLPFRRG
jgi:hypothetical protein